MLGFKIFGDLSTDLTSVVPLTNNSASPLHAPNVEDWRAWYWQSSAVNEIKVYMACFAQRQRTCHRPPQASLVHLAGRMLWTFPFFHPQPM